MRDIKFRGKPINGTGWVYGYYVYQFEIGYYSQGYTDVPPRVHYIFGDKGDFCEVDPATVGQYVNYYGIEFYNGDIMLIACDCDSEYGCTHNDGIYTVVWNKETAGYALKSQSNGRLYPLDEYGEENMHVAGNIYDNPELLKLG
ncbi:hypothetical protein H7K28_06895 [Paenibacillus polymyxa]|jgi:hypothetical protein|uniref:YopX family protein n=1 Tax=Paenibacillus polymyxa TaxID=1406 RepID=UPI00157FC1C9|nr:YopX family protein [Paenibacillus polymyxa]MBY0020759.1 hypothetical protein [Paenibacillus polymyxa]MBY0059063.1 hypothetical protein [Paenibacillus polymyxa]MBY0069650.1 hypothetical protein [Paenibacillus polymyxa]MBY0083267.1 hypothetical protein [Paenibacillus polymyxa]MBZ6441833.1 YopX family protein [Paenibacillus polymyxa]